MEKMNKESKTYLSGTLYVFFFGVCVWGWGVGKGRGNGLPYWLLVIHIHGVNFAGVSEDLA